MWGEWRGVMSIGLPMKCKRGCILVVSKGGLHIQKIFHFHKKKYLIMPWQGGELWEEKCIFMWLLSTITLQSDLRPARFIIGRQLQQQNFKCESAEELRNCFRYDWITILLLHSVSKLSLTKSLERLTILWVLWRSKNPSPWLVLWVWSLSVLSAPGFWERYGPVVEISFRI